jgi:hypothetical protein
MSFPAGRVNSDFLKLKVRGLWSQSPTPKVRTFTDQTLHSFIKQQTLQYHIPYNNTSQYNNQSTNFQNNNNRYQNPLIQQTNIHWLCVTLNSNHKLINNNSNSIQIKIIIHRQIIKTQYHYILLNNPNYHLMTFLN